MQNVCSQSRVNSVVPALFVIILHAGSVINFLLLNLSVYIRQGQLQR